MISVPNILDAAYRQVLKDFGDNHKTGVLTPVFTDMMGSTRLKQELGDTGGVALIKRQQVIVREILAGFAEAQEINTAGDSFFLAFIRPSDAVRFSLALQARLWR
jgi:class 3 adenylate cyclase